MNTITITTPKELAGARLRWHVYRDDETRVVTELADVSLGRAVTVAEACTRNGAIPCCKGFGRALGGLTVGLSVVAGAGLALAPCLNRVAAPLVITTRAG